MKAALDKRLPFIHVGDVVECIKAAGRDKLGLPLHVPTVGNLYTVTSIYLAPYGVGCTLEGMDHEPYKGYFLFAFGKLHFQPVQKES